MHNFPTQKDIMRLLVANSNRKVVIFVRIKPIVISFKQSEIWISDYARCHNSPAAWIKDLIIQDYNKSKTQDINAFGGFNNQASTSLFDD